MRMLSLALAFSLSTISADSIAQQAVLPDSPGTEWQRLETVAPGSRLHLAGSFGRRDCRIGSVTADSLTCAGPNQVVLRRADIRSAKTEHRGRSALVMGGLGAGIGVIVVAATSAAVGFRGIKGSVAAGGAGLGAVVFAPIGYFNDPTASTLYRK